ncbi:MAG: hypothetical protein ABEJ84_08240 [Halodesulfurarchaeum sp.]
MRQSERPAGTDEGMLRVVIRIEPEGHCPMLQFDVNPEHIEAQLAGDVCLCKAIITRSETVVEVGPSKQHRTFVANHLDWLPAFDRLVKDAAAVSPFHRRYVTITDQLFGKIRERLDIADPTPSEIDAMLERVQQGMSGVPDEAQSLEWGTIYTPSGTAVGTFRSERLCRRCWAS